MRYATASNKHKTKEGNEEEEEKRKKKGERKRKRNALKTQKIADFSKLDSKSTKSDLVGGYSSISEYDTSFRLPPSSPYDKFLKAAGC
ncbi:hypothetical protein AAC387_Pa08g0836 [Persea americana]